MVGYRSAAMILESASVPIEAFERATGWTIQPQGACKGDACIPLDGDIMGGGAMDVRALAERLRMPLVHDERHGLFALGPSSGGNALMTATAPDLELPLHDGGAFRLSSLRGQKVFLLAWASW